MNPDEFDPRDLFDVPDPYGSEAGGQPAAPEPPWQSALPSAPSRARVRATRLFAVAAAIACEVALVAGIGLRDRATLTGAAVAYGVVLPLLSAAIAWIVVQPSSSRRARGLAALVLGASVFVATTGLARAPGDESVSGIVACVVGGMMMAAGPCLLGLFSLRHAFATGATWRGAAVGLASGLMGAAATRLTCPDDAFLHVLVGHGAPILLATLAAAALGPRVTRS